MMSSEYELGTLYCTNNLWLWVGIVSWPSSYHPGLFVLFFMMRDWSSFKCHFHFLGDLSGCGSKQSANWAIKRDIQMTHYTLEDTTIRSLMFIYWACLIEVKIRFSLLMVWHFISTRVLDEQSYDSRPLLFCVHGIHLSPKKNCSVPNLRHLIT